MKFKNIFLMSALLFGFQEVKPVFDVQNKVTTVLGIASGVVGIVCIVSGNNSVKMIGGLCIAIAGMLGLQNFQLKKCKTIKLLKSPAKKI